MTQPPEYSSPTTTTSSPSQPVPRKAAGPDWRKRITRFPATYGLIALTLAVFLGQWLSVQTLGVDLPLIYGAKVGVAVAAGEVWRLVTPIFLHVGLWHVFVNMYSLYALGPAVERFFGSNRFLVFYLLAGVAGVGMSLAMSLNPSVGASGSIFGMLGALVAFLYRHRELFGRGGMLQFRHLVIVALLNLGLGLAPGIDNWGHVGGLLGGLGLTWFLGPRLEVSMSEGKQIGLVDARPWRDVKRAAVTAGLVILSLALLAAISPLAG